MLASTRARIRSEIAGVIRLPSGQVFSQISATDCGFSDIVTIVLAVGRPLRYPVLAERVRRISFRPSGLVSELANIGIK